MEWNFVDFLFTFILTRTSDWCRNKRQLSYQNIYVYALMKCWCQLYIIKYDVIVRKSVGYFSPHPIKLSYWTFFIVSWWLPLKWTIGISNNYCIKPRNGNSYKPGDGLRTQTSNIKETFHTSLCTSFQINKHSKTKCVLIP